MKTNTFALAATLSALTAMAAHADVTLRFSHWIPESHPLVQTGFNAWMASITEASGGSIKFEVYPAQQLGAAKDHYDMVRDGIADIGWINPGYQPGRFPIISAPEVPMTVANADSGTHAIDAWYRDYAGTEMSDVRFCLTHVNQPSALHSKIEIRSPKQLDSMKIRPSNAVIASYVRGAGAVNVQVAAPEAREALEKGTADAIFFPTGQLEPYGLDEIVKFHIDYPLYTQAAVIAIGKATYNGMTDAEKVVIDAHCTPEWAEKMVTGWNQFERDSKATLEADSAHSFTMLTDEEVAQWRALVGPSIDGWKADVTRAGHDAEAVWTSFTTALDAAGALNK